MTESPEQKSKRQFCTYLRDNEWVFQVSFFYQTKEASNKAIEDSKRLKNSLSRRFPETAILWRMQLKRFSNYYISDVAELGYTNMPYHVFYFSQYITDFDFFAWCEQQFEENLYLQERRLHRAKIDRAIKSILKGKPHKLKEHFGRVKVNRFSLLNKKALIAIDGSRL